MTASTSRSVDDASLRRRLVDLPSLLAAAPHRLLFLVGAANVLAAMAWWAIWLARMRWGIPAAMPAPAMHPGWLHAIVMTYFVLPPFIFGFAMTVVPRWIGAPALARSRYVPVGLGLLVGQVLVLAGASGSAPSLVVGACLATVAWIVGTLVLFGVVWRDETITWHAVSLVAALAIGAVGLVAFVAFLATGSPRLIFVAIKIGSVGMLLPIYFTVCHRMIPFFTGNVVKDYVVVRPMAALGAFWTLVFAHLALELVHAYGALWVVDAPLAALGAWLTWRWLPRAAMPPLLAVLFAGFAWLPVAMLLYAIQSAWFAWSGEFALGRAPAHALFVGYYGSLLVAMVTRVTQGHSGRPLELGTVGGFAFVTVQVVAVTRIVAEVARDGAAWQAIAALGWLIAFLPWVIRSGLIYLSPRIDGKPG